VSYPIETNIIANAISTAPMPVNAVKDSPRRIVEIITETMISFKRITEEVTGEIFFNPLDQM
jgi:hypothetical protein